MRLLLAGAVCTFLLVGVQAANEITFGDGFQDDFENVFVASIPSPTDVEISRNGEVMFVTQKEGVLWVVEDFQENNAKAKKVLDLKDIVCENGERALGGVAVHPNFPDTPWVYVYYTYNKFNDCDESFNVETGPVNRLSRYVWDADRGTIDESSEKVFFDTPRLPSKNHNSGDIAFGKDGHLYVTVGDGGGRAVENDDGVVFPQALDRLLGKVVRLTDDGDVPDDNPFTPSSGHEDSARCKDTGLAPRASIKCQEIYSYGHRNPIRFAMNPNKKETSYFINEVGRSTWEEINEGGDRFKGANYGYPKRDGPCKDNRDTDCEKPGPEYEDPVHWYHHDEEKGGCVTAGAFVPDDIGWPSSVEGSYLYADYSMKKVYVIKPGGEGCPYPQCDPPTSDYEPTQKTFVEWADRFISMQFGKYGDTQALYYVCRGGTRGVYRIQYTGERNRSPIAKLSATPIFGFSPLLVNFDGTGSVDPDGDDIAYEWDVNEDGVTDSTSPKTWYEYTKPGTYYATLVVDDGSGGRDEATVVIEVDNTPPIPLITSPAEGTMFAVGDKFTLEGSATDEQDGIISDSSLTWEVRENHDTHYLPFMDETNGNSLEIIAGEPEDFDAATTSYLEIRLTATDSSGLSMTTSRILRPKMVELEFDTIPTGLNVMAYGDVIETPAKVLTWKNHKFFIEAMDQTLEGDVYSWISWLDGGKKRHEYVASSSNSGYIEATFEKSQEDADEDMGVVDMDGEDTDADVEDTVVTESPVSTSVVELLNFYVELGIERSQRHLRENILDSQSTSLESAVIDQLSSHLRNKFDDTLKTSEIPYATLHRIRLTQKGDWDLSNNDSTYQRMLGVGGVAIFRKEKQDQHVPTKFAVHSMQLDALNDASSELLPALKESDPSDNFGTSRIVSLSIDVIPDESVEQAADGKNNTITIVAIVIGVCVGLALVLGAVIFGRRRSARQNNVAEMHESRSSDKEKSSFSNTDSDNDNSPPATPEKQDPESSVGCPVSSAQNSAHQNGAMPNIGLYDQVTQFLQVDGSEEKAVPTEETKPAEGQGV